MSTTPGMEFDPKFNWIDVEDPNNPPAGASKITANDLKRYEQGIEDAEKAIDQLLTVISDEINVQVGSLTEGLADSAIWPDTRNPGLYWFRQGGQLVESGTPGLYLIDPTQTPMPNYEIPSGVMVQTLESGGSYIRPTNDTNVVCTFVGTSDPLSVALDGDRWDKTPATAGANIIQYIKINGEWV